MDDAAIERLVTLWKHLPPEEQLTYLNQLERAAAALSVPDPLTYPRQLGHIFP